MEEKQDAIKILPSKDCDALLGSDIHSVPVNGMML